ncbi:MAG: VanZ family protein [Syntrophomonadaceae bacterium]|nr:VanZ family protein [Syntrophomonadaceae bacterium]
MKKEKQSTLTIVLMVVYLLLLIGIVMFKLPFYSEISDGVRMINLIPLQGSFDENRVILLHEIVDNTLLFIPLGIYICALKNEWPFKKKFFSIIGVSLSFEVLQFIFALGRSDITDILDNALGGIIGIGIYVLLSWAFKSKTVKVVNMLALTVTVCVVLGFAYLFYLSHFVMGC